MHSPCRPLQRGGAGVQVPHRGQAGLTGYTQVYGKYNTSPEDKLKLDMLYIETQSLLLDFKLALLTIKIIFSPESTEGFDKDRSERINRRDREGNENQWPT